MRIAICISGYLRKYKELYPNFKRNILEPCQRVGETDVFVATWDTLNSKSSFSFKQGDAPPDYGPFDLYDVYETYGTPFVGAANFDEHKTLFDIRKFDPSIDLNKLHPNIHENGILFGLSMFQRRYVCNKMKQAVEIDKGPYDLVIQMRPDIFFLKPLDVESLDLSKVSSRTLYNDHLLASNSKTIDDLSEVYPEAGRMIKQYGWTRAQWFEPFCPEHFLEHRFNELGITESHRHALGEDFMTLYPRKNFVPSVHYLLNMTGRTNELPTLLSGGLSYLNL